MNLKNWSVKKNFTSNLMLMKFKKLIKQKRILKNIIEKYQI